MEMKKQLRNQKGFTLIEIIAVLIILGILAAVAIPRYFALIDDAGTKGAQAALGESKARVGLYFAQYLDVNDGSCPGDSSYNGSSLGTDGGDYTFSYSAGGGRITITAGDGTYSANDNIILPQCN